MRIRPDPHHWLNLPNLRAIFVVESIKAMYDFQCLIYNYSLNRDIFLPNVPLTNSKITFIYFFEFNLLSMFVYFCNRYV